MSPVTTARYAAGSVTVARSAVQAAGTIGPRCQLVESCVKAAGHERVCS
jgi:hypothetical protein